MPRRPDPGKREVQGHYLDATRWLEEIYLKSKAVHGGPPLRR
jgi:hypothetical protein